MSVRLPGWRVVHPEAIGIRVAASERDPSAKGVPKAEALATPEWI